MICFWWLFLSIDFLNANVTTNTADEMAYADQVVDYSDAIWKNQTDAKIASIESRVPWPNFGQFPYAVSIQTRRNRAQACGGSIWTRDLVLSSCSCTFIQSANDTATFYLIVAGGLSPFGISRFHEDARTTSQVRNVKQIIRHPKCTPNNVFEYDVALLQVDAPFYYSRTLTLTHFNIWTMNQTSLKEQLAELVEGNTTCETFGWGQHYPNDDAYPYSDILHFAKLSPAPLDDCLQDFCRLNGLCDSPQFRSGKICYKTLGINSKVCDGDRGGPLVCKGFVYGILSLHNECQQDDTDSHLLFQTIDSIMPFLGQYKSSANINANINIVLILAILFIKI